MVNKMSFIPHICIIVLIGLSEIFASDSINSTQSDSEKTFYEAYDLYEANHPNLPPELLEKIESLLKKVVAAPDLNEEILSDTACFLLVLGCTTSFNTAKDRLWTTCRAATYSQFIKDVRKIKKDKE